MPNSIQPFRGRKRALTANINSIRPTFVSTPYNCTTSTLSPNPTPITPFELDCSKLNKLKMPLYNPLIDKNLESFFKSQRMRRHLIRMKLVALLPGQ